MIHKYSDCSCGGILTLSTWDIDDAMKKGKTIVFCEKCQKGKEINKSQVEIWRSELYKKEVVK